MPPLDRRFCKGTSQTAQASGRARRKHSPSSTTARQHESRVVSGRCHGHDPACQEGCCKAHKQRCRVHATASTHALLWPARAPHLACVPCCCCGCCPCLPLPLLMLHDLNSLDIRLPQRVSRRTGHMPMKTPLIAEEARESCVCDRVARRAVCCYSLIIMLPPLVCLLACYSYLFKLLLIGDSGVGKSCLLLRFAVRAC